MKGSIDMSRFNYRIINLPEPTLESEPATRKWVSDKYISKAKLTTAEWSWWYKDVGSTHKYPFHNSGWPTSIRTDEITGDTNVEIRNINV